MRNSPYSSIRSFRFLALLLPACVMGSEYWQQHVAYEIHVTLDDSAHTLTCRETLIYTNHSPDSLEYIWFHLWPNAYKNRETAFAKQKLDHYSTRFFYTDEDDRGYIDSLNFTVDGHPLSWEYHPRWIDVAQVFLKDPLPPGASVTVETPFFLKIPLVFSRLGHSGKHYEITQWYPKPAVYDRDGWHPMPYLDQGEFYSEFGSFDVYITLPKEYRIMATGDLVDGDEEYAWLDSLAAEGESLHSLDKKAFKKKVKKLRKGRKKSKKLEEKGERRSADEDSKILHFHQENVHDFAWFADADWIVRKGELWFADSSRKVTLWSMYLPKNAKLWENSIEYVHDAGYWYSKFYGDYPYNHITAVDGDLSAGGGMEYPNITVISSGGSKDLLEFVIMHEVGHNWFYGILGSNERDHAWMDEGLNEYSNIRYWEKKYPHRNGALTIVDFLQNKLGIARNLDFSWIHYFGYQARAASGDDQPIEMTSADFDRGNYGSIVYFKTAVCMRFLHHYLGEERIDQIMQDYYETWKFKHPTPAEFRSFFEKHLDEDLSWFFADMINHTKVIDYSVSKVEDDGVEVENLGSMSPPVELAFYNESGTEIKREWMGGFEGARTVFPPRGTVKVAIDPDNHMPDLNRQNNFSHKPPHFNFVFDQPTFDHVDINLVPWLAWNAYNRTTTGVVAYAGFIPGYRFGISLSPQWDFRHSRPVGHLTAQKTFYQSLGFRSWSVRARLGDYSGRQGGQVSFAGTVRRAIKSTPSLSFNTTFFYHHIEDKAVNPNFYESGDYTVGRVQVRYRHRPNAFVRYEGGSGVTLGTGSGSFGLVHVTGHFRWRYHKKLVFKARGWLGTFFLADDVPPQYRIWMSGGVDPDFANSFVFDRTPGETTTFLRIYDHHYILAGPGLRGAVRKASTATAWGLNMDQSLSLGPVSAFGDVAGATDLNKVFWDAGLKVSIGVLHLYIPLYQSWEEASLITGYDWLKARIRFELSPPSIVLGGS
ncbi:MAG: M1 family metallopeptidase [Candidatus Neomarinimicrobiota bacterium]